MTAPTIVARDRPILMSGPMVRATLDLRKTKTRRVVMPQPSSAFPEGELTGDFLKAHVRCPYGQPGDRLWVRETFAVAPNGAHVVAYQADGECGAWIGDGDGGRLWLRHGGVTDRAVPTRAESWRGQSFGLGRFGGKWKPSIFMPRWASRLTLELTEVGVERLQNISEADALAEGACIHENPSCAVGAGRFMYAYEAGPHNRWELDVQTAYRKLWDSLNAKRGFGWAVNPWVWALTFKVVTP